jgi:hypothetical protein
LTHQTTGRVLKRTPVDWSPMDEELAALTDEELQDYLDSELKTFGFF